ncbi:MAG: alpha/beta hydrolase [Mobilitalea sp.]
MKKRNKILLVGSAMMTLCTVGLAGAGLYFYNFAIKRSSKQMPFENMDNSTDTEIAEKEANNMEWMENHEYKVWRTFSEDGLELVGYYVPAEEPTVNTVIIAHGYKSKAKDMIFFAMFFRDKLGYNVLMPDARGHGDSEGNYVGFGWHERKDYQRWIHEVIERTGEDAQIVLFGTSMGGATVMMTSGEELPPQVKVIIEDCGYSSVEEQLAYQLKTMYRLPGFPIVNATSLLTKIKAGYDFSEASALEQVKKDKLPMLFIHGGEDKFVPTEMVYKLYEACPAEKDLLVVEGADHVMSIIVDPESYESKVGGFLNKYIKSAE